MSLEKAIYYGKEHRKPYRKSKAFDSSCRNHGGCSWCLGNHTYQDQKLAERVSAEFELLNDANGVVPSLVGSLNSV